MASAAELAAANYRKLLAMYGLADPQGDVQEGPTTFGPPQVAPKPVVQQGDAQQEGPTHFGPPQPKSRAMSTSKRDVERAAFEKGTGLKGPAAHNLYLDTHYRNSRGFSGSERTAARALFAKERGLKPETSTWSRSDVNYARQHGLLPGGHGSLSRLLREARRRLRSQGRSGRATPSKGSGVGGTSTQSRA